MERAIERGSERVQPPRDAVLVESRRHEREREREREMEREIERGCERVQPPSDTRLWTYTKTISFVCIIVDKAQHELNMRGLFQQCHL